MKLLMPLMVFIVPVLSEPVRIFVVDSSSWPGTGIGGYIAADRTPQTVEVVKRFGEQCKPVTVTINKDKADFVVMFEGWTVPAKKNNRIAVFNRNGDSIFSGATVSLGNAVKDACAAIAKAAPAVAPTPTETSKDRKQPEAQ